MKKNIKSMEELAAHISQLETAEYIQTAALKSQAKQVLYDLKPSSLFKAAIGGIRSSSTLKQNAIDTSLSAGAGWLVKKVIQANSKSIFRRLAGSVLQYITTGILTRKMPLIREKISGH